jgi:hypothetical protein
MGVPQHEYLAAKSRWFSLDPVDTNADGQVSVVAVEVEGVNGADGRGGHRRVTYRLLIDLSSIRQIIPTVWVVSPPDGAIAHANIFRAARCPILGNRDLPYLCWGSGSRSFAEQWQKAAPSQRTLSALLENVQQQLNNPNYDSRARA